MCEAQDVEAVVAPDQKKGVGVIRKMIRDALFFYEL